ncbi:hypothetical protein KEH56_36645 [Burkholderia cenocepacia]|uniref:hypothetical protein n=1 Tax=Burkholderia cenocepacia TaxID=95486 RepID=UPI001BA7DCB3|nr:hypothetical protein [Burkholderia cenocepacia]QUN44701.1 hypothetical protein KEH56_36645 [Burkholderia cenocepacia]
MLDSDVFSDRKFARDILAWVQPSARDTSAYRDMVTRFEHWAITQGAREVRGILLADETAERLAHAAERYGYGVPVSSSSNRCRDERRRWHDHRQLAGDAGPAERGIL